MQVLRVPTSVGLSVRLTKDPTEVGTLNTSSQRLRSKKTNVQTRYIKFLTLIAVMIGAMLLAACGSGSDAGPANTVAATVNGKKIMVA